MAHSLPRTRLYNIYLSVVIIIIIYGPREEEGYAFIFTVPGVNSDSGRIGRAQPSPSASGSVYVDVM